MSCEIKGIANVVNLNDVKTRLLRGANQKFDHVSESELPLRNCIVSLSPTGDILTIAWNTRLVILASKWDSQESSDVKNKFHVIWDGDVTTKQNEWITSIICLPIISNGQSSGGIGTEWTYIGIGLNSGFVKFYTETGELLLEEQLHNESIISIKCQSHCSAKHAGDTGTTEEIHVLYNSTVCILQGYSLFSTLKAQRNYVARVKANCGDKPPVVNLTCKKWGFKNQDIINDCEVIGTTSVNTFDHLMTASICGGYNSNYRSSAPQHSLVIATGKRPFVGFHYAFEGSSAPVLSDVAIAMASKVVNSIGSAIPWFKSNSKNPSTPEKAKGLLNEPAETMMCRFGISDILREGDSIIISPNKLLSVICDALGRVLLVDNIQGIITRIWKGYRNAQCGWIETVEERDHTKIHQSKTNSTNNQRHRRCKALFLVIYAPKKGIIDIWSIQNGSKITTFSASKNGRLLYTNYGLCGLNDIIIKSGNRPQYPCIFIDSLGGIKEIIVPFHFALSSLHHTETSNKSRDLHLFNKLKKFLKGRDFDDDKLINEITTTCSDLETIEVQLQTIEMLMVNKHITPDALLASVECFSEKLESQEDVSESSSKTLDQLLQKLKKLIKFYKYVKTQYDPEYTAITSDVIPDIKQLSSILFTSEREVQRILSLSKTIANLKNSNLKIQNRVRFKEDERLFVDFLSCFDFTASGSLGLQKDLNYDKKCQISKLIFQGWMCSNDPVLKWQEYALNSDIQPGVLIQFALLYWLNKNIQSLETELINLTKLLNAICSLHDTEEICTNYNKASYWWSDVRNILMNSTNPFNALTAALACRAVSINMQKNKDRLQTNLKEDNEDEKDEKKGNKLEEMLEDNNKEQDLSAEEEMINNINDWERVSKDTCQLSLLIGNLEDITVLNAIVCKSPKLDETTQFYTIPYETTSVSLEEILCKGKGSVSEIVSKWLSATGIEPKYLIDETDAELEQLNLQIDSEKVSDSADEVKDVQLSQGDSRKLLSSVEIDSEAIAERTAFTLVLDKLALLKQYFPYSLSSSILLTNLLWQFVMFWSKDIMYLDALEASLSVLRHIPYNRLRHGACCLLWNIHLKKRIESAGKLINKLGKLPKERLCIQDVGLTDTQLIEFFKHCITFLDIWQDAVVVEEENCSFIRSEELWEGHTGGSQPLADVAISQTPAQYDLIVLHWQLTNVFYMMSYFNLKLSKPIDNLFHSMAHRYFFQDISHKVSIPSYKDDKKDNMRVEFLCRVVTASMESIHQETLASNVNFTEASLWINRCKDLALTWKLNVDELSIHQVCQLYINGFDRLAEEASFFVNNQETLAAKLLPIAGGRTMAHISKVPDLLEEVARISPALTTYLQNLKWDFPDTVFTNCSNEDRVELVKKVYRNISETHNEYHIAQQMLDASSISEDETSENINK